MDSKDIAKLYGARWNIELLFKELKSKYVREVLDPKNEHVIEALIWTAILTLIVLRRIHSLVKNNDAHPEISTKNLSEKSVMHIEKPK